MGKFRPKRCPVFSSIAHDADMSLTTSLQQCIHEIKALTDWQLIDNTMHTIE